MAKCVVDGCGVEFVPQSQWARGRFKNCCKVHQAEKEAAALVASKAARAQSAATLGQCGVTKFDGTPCKSILYHGAKVCSTHDYERKAREAEARKAQWAADAKRREDERAFNAAAFKPKPAPARRPWVEAPAKPVDKHLAKAEELAEADPVANAVAIRSLTELAKEIRMQKWAAWQDAKYNARKGQQRNDDRDDLY